MDQLKRFGPVKGRGTSNVWLNFESIKNFRGNFQEITSFKPANGLIFRKGIKTPEKVKKKKIIGLQLQCNGYIQTLFSQSDPIEGVLHPFKVYVF